MQRLIGLGTGCFIMAVAMWMWGEEVRPARPPKDKLLLGEYGAKGVGKEIIEGRRIILDEDSYPREPAKIVEGPKVSKKGDGFAISFTLDRPDDVLIRIVDGTGKTVRDVICGVLGWNAPEPLKVDSLSQEVFWDGKDTKGKDLSSVAPGGGGCRVRLCVGLTPRFDRFVAYDPEQIQPTIGGMEVDLQGRVYVAQATHRLSDNHLTRYDREGKYLDTVFPPNPNYLKGKLEDVTCRYDYVDGRAVPKRRGFWPTFMGKAAFGTHTLLHWFPLRISGDGRAYILDPSLSQSWYPEPVYHSWKEAEEFGIYRVGPEISMRMVNVPLDPFWFLEHTGVSPGMWSLGGDGFVYAVIGNYREQVPQIWKLSMTSESRSRLHLKVSPDFECNGADKRNEKTHYIGVDAPQQGQRQAEIDARMFNWIYDLSIDEEGILYVADTRTTQMGERPPEIKGSLLKVFQANGRLMGDVPEIELGGKKTPMGDVFGVRVGKDSLYVVARLEPEKEKDIVRAWKRAHVVKFARSSGGQLKAVWAAPLDGSAQLVAVDEKASPPIVWVGNGNGPATFTRIVDGGSQPGEVRHCGGGLRKNVFIDPWAIALDGKGGIYVYDQERDRIVRTNDNASEWVESEPCGHSQTAFHADRRRDTLYVNTGTRIWRYNRDLKRENTGREFARPASGSMAGLGVIDAEGNVYIGDYRAADYYAAGAKGQDFAGVVSKFSPKGELIKKDCCLTYGVAGSIAADSKGNFYLADVPTASITAASHNMPEEPWYRSGKHIDTQSGLAYVVKFPPEGGNRCTDTELWAHLGVSQINAGQCKCTITSNMMAADDSDRIYATDMGRYHVKVLDTAGNLITRVGSWGNADCQGPKSKYSDPEIAFGWLFSIDACGDYLYASDRDLSRVVKVRMDYREVKEAAVQ